MSPRTANFRRQHQEINGLITELQRLISQDIEAKAEEIRALLSQLIGRLKVHLATEDNVLYPAMLAAPDSQVRGKTKEFMEEMGALAEVLKEYSIRWSTSRVIKKEPLAFREDSARILKQLTYRISREEELLYPLADALAH
ncbi:MAG: hemerythrin domain-containing protein [Limnochordia bacterium]